MLRQRASIFHTDHVDFAQRERNLEAGVPVISATRCFSSAAVLVSGSSGAATVSPPMRTTLMRANAGSGGASLESTTLAFFDG